MNQQSNFTPPSAEFISFVSDNLNADISKLVLKCRKLREDFNVDFALTQIECRRRTAKKLQRFIANPKFIFPSSIASEQSSNESVSAYHCSLISDCSTLLDMTAGLGIDLMVMAERCESAIGIELDELKAEVLRYNCEVMGVNNVEVICADSVEWVSTCRRRFNVIFIDPARRGEGNTRTYNFHDCQPDIIEIQNLLREKCDSLMIKASPLLDITQTLKDIDCVTAIRAVCVNGECKEILIESACKNDSSQTITNSSQAIINPSHTIINPSQTIINSTHTIIKEAVDLNDKGEVKSKFSCIFNPDDPARSSIPYAEDKDLTSGNFLYEPNAGIMKLAPWSELCSQFTDLKKLAPSSHLFVSSTLYPHFPGRILEIEKLIEKKDRKTLKGLPANVTVRNYPISAQELRKSLQVKEGKDTFIYASRLKNPVLILAKRFKPE